MQMQLNLKVFGSNFESDWTGAMSQLWLVSIWWWGDHSYTKHSTEVISNLLTPLSLSTPVTWQIGFILGIGKLRSVPAS